MTKILTQVQEIFAIEIEALHSMRGRIGQEVAYLQRQSLWFDIRIVWLTFVKVLRRDGVSH